MVVILEVMEIIIPLTILHQDPIQGLIMEHPQEVWLLNII